MVIGFGAVTLRMADCHSLKEKRKIVKSIISRSRNSFNASIAEISLNDAHQQAVIGFAMVGNDRSFINSSIDKLIEFIENLQIADIIDSSLEIMSI
ncbi:MAG: DUF503 domain-containing protein [Desulfobacterales bacterium]|jgi:hypothetical protein|nr:DUF503 domain-containing protein [Desulfobacterales bacterium]